MKKYFSFILVALAMFATTPVQAQSDIDLNKNFNERFVQVTYIYGGRVVGISTYLSVRERPSVNSREVMRLPNGTTLTLRFIGDQNWWQIVAINGNYCDGIGYVSARYISIK